MNKPKHIPTIDSLEALNELMTLLLKEQGIVGRWEQLQGSTEGGPLPGGIPKLSGTILVEDGHVFTYWLDWDPNKTAPDGTKGWYTLGENDFIEYEGKKLAYFHEILPGDESYPKPDDRSFLAAKQKLDLS
ncbi:MAG: hypothetical protein HYW38_01205 [Candidatus Colwellbacteria bacterium]|nr:hypothetical protein [Candidatus Colwellbacteria bacterium]